MKSLKDYSLNISEEQYHADPAWSHSKIARYAREGFSALATLNDKTEQTPSLRFGSLFDAIITHGDTVTQEYTVFEKDVPPARKEVLDRIAELTDVAELALVDESIIRQALEECDYKAAKKYETQYEHLVEYADYYSVKKSGKKIVTKQEWDDAVEMARILKSDEYHKTLFNQESGTDCEFLYQLQFKAKMWVGERLVEVRIMPDLLIVNHVDKTVQPVDLKTSSCQAYEFAEQFVKYRYDIQAQMYSDVLRVKLNSIKGYEDYTILPYIFSDISRSDKTPVSYVYPQDDASQRDGLSYCIGERNYQYKGWRELLGEILHYEETNAVVPDYISTDKPNDLLSILGRK